MALLSVSYAQSPYGDAPPKPSMMDSLSSGFKQAGQAMAPKPTVNPPSDDPISLQTKTRPDSELFVAVAHLYEESGRLDEAEAQYKKALRESPNDARALLGYARLKDRMGQPQESLKLYQKAVKLYPEDPSVYNNLAVHYARQKQYGEARAALAHAVQLRPNDPKYRNNIATLLVELGRPQDAFTELRAVHSEAAAHYNLGYLLQKKGQAEAAVQEFHTALDIDPSLSQARQWLNRIGAQDRALASGYRPVMPPSLGRPPAVPREEPRLEANVARPLPEGPQYGSLPPGPRPQAPPQYGALPSTPRDVPPQFAGRQAWPSQYAPQDGPPQYASPQAGPRQTGPRQDGPPSTSWPPYDIVADRRMDMVYRLPPPPGSGRPVMGPAAPLPPDSLPQRLPPTGGTMTGAPQRLPPADRSAVGEPILLAPLPPIAR
ncbi:MAG: tetratricopeptide repeat protein [Thermoguttaceae bacterium]